MTRRWTCAAALLLAGCGGATGPRAVPAGGTVIYLGKPLEQGTIVFFPVDDARMQTTPNGEIKDGKFSLSTYVSGDGAPAGEYKVGIRSTTEVPGKGGEVTTKALVPEVYNYGTTSGIGVSIPPKGDKNMEIRFGEEAKPK
jgi:hypothetical protein